MKAIHYAGGVVLTGDALADSVMHYAESLARKESSATVQIPACLDDGSIVQVSLLLGPASQLVAIPHPGSGDELTDPAVVADFTRRAALLGDPKPVASDLSELAPAYDDDVGRNDPPFS